MIAALEAYRAGLFNRHNILNNIVSGIIVGLVALPLAMAFAIASGAKPEQGLYTAIVAAFVVSVFGGSRLQIAGPTGAFIVILADITAKYGIDGLQIATLMAGVILVILGVARLGSIIRFIPNPVITGFTAGIGVIIFVGQWKDFFGLHPAAGAHFHEKFLHLLVELPNLHLATTGIAVMSLLIVLLTPKVVKHIPGPLVALIAATLVQAYFHFDGVATIGSAFGGIPQSLPMPTLPEVTMTKIVTLMGPAITVAMLGAIESLLSAVVADGMAGTKHNSNQELIGQGLANILTPFFGGFAATGAIARTATNVRNGGNSPLSGVIHSVALVLIIVLAAPLAAHIPLAALAAILFVVSYNMSDIGHFVHTLKRAPRYDIAVLLVTFGLTVFVDLVIAVNIGVVLATLMFMHRMSETVEVRRHHDEHLHKELGADVASQIPAGVMVYMIDGPFFFGASENFERAMNSINEDPRVLILRFGEVPYVDVTGLQTLQEVVEHFRKRHVRVILSDISPRIRRKLDKAGIFTLLGEENVYPHLADIPFADLK